LLEQNDLQNSIFSLAWKIAWISIVEIKERDVGQKADDFLRKRMLD